MIAFFILQWIIWSWVHLDHYFRSLWGNTSTIIIWSCVHIYHYFRFYVVRGSATGKHTRLCSLVPIFQVIMGEYHWETCKAVFRGTNVSGFHGGVPPGSLQSCVQVYQCFRLSWESTTGKLTQMCSLASATLAVVSWHWGRSHAPNWSFLLRHGPSGWLLLKLASSITSLVSSSFLLLISPFLFSFFFFLSCLPPHPTPMMAVSVLLIFSLSPVHHWEFQSKSKPKIWIEHCLFFCVCSGIPDERVSIFSQPLCINPFWSYFHVNEPQIF